MRAYMKSELPFFGVQAAGVREVCRLVPAESLDEIRKLWDEAQHREERYVAIGLSREFVSPEALLLFEHMIVTGAWWDLVDPVAIHRVGPLLPAVHDTVLAWSTDSHLWKRRAAIICQNARKADTDPALLYDCVQPNLSDPGFFIRKAIGWALRERSKLAPEEVFRFVETHELSPLSRREALKRLDQARA
jgi:3-methyladenine DNA glycosylase AlkD